MYDLSAALMDKGIIIGVEHELAIRSNLPFVLFRQSTSVSYFFNESYAALTNILSLTSSSNTSYSTISKTDK